MLWRAVYVLATWLALPFVLGYFAWRGRREPAYRRHWHERLGIIDPVPGAPLWVHAASVGEVALVAPLIDALTSRVPDLPILITTMTPTGRERACATFGERAAIRYLPLDTLGATRRFLHRVAPRTGLLVETELWPNLIAAAERDGVPMVLINASVSARSAQRYGRFPLAGATRFMLSHLTVGAASAAHARRFVALGAPPERVEATGNLKYDTPDNRAVQARGAALRERWQAIERPLWVAASTHAGEETFVLDAFARLREAHPDALLVIAPRHPQRFDEVAALLEAQRWSLARRSRNTAVDAGTDIVLADTLGEVPMFYAAADVAFVGGSAVAGIGGHNVLEPAALARALCVGPHVDEWREIVDALVAAGAAQVCDTSAALADATSGWLACSDRARSAGQAGYRHVHEHAGALARSLALIEAVLERPCRRPNRL